MVNENATKVYGTDDCLPTSELLENKIRYNFRLGDITWVKHSGSSWWPAQVIDEECVGSKPKKKGKYDCLVRLYGTCQYLCIDPWKSNSDFEMMLKQENKSAMEVFHEVLEKELSCVNLPSDYDEEAVNSKGGYTKVTSKKTSSRKVRKQERLKHKGSETEEQYSEGEEKDVGKRKRGRARQSSSSHDKKQTVDKTSRESSSEGLRNKIQKQVAQGDSVDRQERLRRPARSNATPEDRTAQLTDTNASEDATENYRDILFKDIINREHDAEMAYVDEVINGICNATEDIVTDGATASTKVEQGIKQSGSGVEGESSNVTQRRVEGKFDQVTEDMMQKTSPEIMKGITDTISRVAAMKEPVQLSTRQIRIMQGLGLIAPSGSPYGRNGVATIHQKF